MRAKHTLWMGAFVLVSTSATAAVFFEAGPDPAIFPPQQIPIYFNHDYHVRKPDEATGVQGEGLRCTFCHEKAGDELTAAETDIPGHSSCDSCHGEWIDDAPVKECARCHKDLDPTGTSSKAAGLTIPPANIKFAHQSHTKAGVECTSCHNNVPNKAVATRDDYPTMDRCVACHLEKQVSVECQTCHLTQPSGRLQTQFASGVLQPNRYHVAAVHQGNFLKDHAVPAQRDKAYCQKCHSESDCLQCHDGVGRDARFHPGDFISTHFMQGKKDDSRCESCHNFQQFCLNCHVKSGVATVGDALNVPTRKTIRVDGTGAHVGPHPMSADGWLTPTSRNFHGFFAQRNIRSCASCHQEQYCITCHGSGTGAGGNPHGPNPQRLKGNTASLRAARACLKCHDPADSSWR